jgi:metallo-beta-lactamase family protein
MDHGDALLKSGAPQIRLFNQDVEVRAEIAEIGSLSAHADRSELLRWCGESLSIGQNPAKVSVVHGEPLSAQSFKKTLEQQFKWNVEVAQHLQEITV